MTIMDINTSRTVDNRKVNLDKDMPVSASAASAKYKKVMGGTSAKKGAVAMTQNPSYHNLPTKLEMFEKYMKDQDDTAHSSLM